MKGFFLVLFITATTLFTPVCAQQKEDIVKALMAGKVETLCASMSSSCELILPSGTWNSGSPCNRLSAFLQANPINRFSLMHQGESDKTAFLVANVQAGQKEYRVYALIRLDGNRSCLEQLRVESI